MKLPEVFENYKNYIMPTYTKTPLVLVKGKGSRLWDINDKVYLDFFPGWGVGNLGHCHPKVIRAIREQAGKLIFIPNNYYHIGQAKLAREIIRCAFPGKVFFCNSGAEAIESAIKFSRKFGASTQPAASLGTDGESFDYAQDGSPKDGELVEPRHRTIGMEKAWDEIHQGADMRVPGIYKFIIKYITPLFLFFILGAWFWQEWIPIIFMKNVSAAGRGYILATRIGLLLVFLVLAIMVKIAWTRKRTQTEKLK